MRDVLPNWLVLKQCAEELTRRGTPRFTRAQLIATVQQRYPDRKRGSLDPIIQGMTVNSPGGAPAGLAKDVLYRIERSLYELHDATRHVRGNAEQVVAPAATPTMFGPARRARLVVRAEAAAPLVLVSCVKSKALSRRAAQDLYTSAWFRKAASYARAVGGCWFILSAKYGLVAPDAELDPYELTLNTMGADERRRWAEAVLVSLRPHLREGQRVVVIAGGRYREHLVPALRGMGCEVEAPLANVVGLGPQQNWLEQAARG